MTTGQDLPNNLGPTLLVGAGLVLLPVVLGLPMVLYGLSLVRSVDGRRTYGFLMPFSVSLWRPR